MKTNEKRLEKMFRDYEQRIGRLRDIEAELIKLDVVGYEEATEKLRSKLKKPMLLEEIEEDFRNLKLALTEVKVLFDNACFHQKKGEQFFAAAKYQAALDEFGASSGSFGRVASDTENLGRHCLLEPLRLRQRAVELSLVQTRCAMICEKSQEAEDHFQKGKIELALKHYEEVLEGFMQESHKAGQMDDREVMAQLEDWVKTTEVSMENCRISLDKTKVEEMYSRARSLSEDVIGRSAEGKFHDASKLLDEIEVLIRDALVVAAQRDFKEARSNLNRLLSEITEQKRSVYNAISTGATSVRFGGRVKEISKGEEPEIGSSIFPWLSGEAEKKEDGMNGRSAEFIDFFKPLALIGEGGMGAVYLFVNPRLRRKEAIKIMREDLQTDKRAVRSFLTEARIAGNLNHENIIKIHDVIESPRLAIRMEFVDGKDLHTLIGEEHMLPWQRAARIAFHVCNALNYAHENGIAHRDVKPRNILVRNDGLIKVLDFGISIAIANTSSGSGRQALLGYSPLYSSPEQRIGRLKDPKSPLWFKSDMYAFGATCYEMVAGSPPFPPGSDLTYNHQYVKPESPASQATDLPESFAKLIMACLEKDPEARLGARDAMKILSSLLRSRPFWNERTVEAEEGTDWVVTK